MQQRRCSYLISNLKIISLDNRMISWISAVGAACRLYQDAWSLPLSRTEYTPPFADTVADYRRDRLARTYGVASIGSSGEKLFSRRNLEANYTEAKLGDYETMRTMNRTLAIKYSSVLWCDQALRPDTWKAVSRLFICPLWSQWLLLSAARRLPRCGLP